MGSESKIPTILRVTTSRFFSKKVPFLKLPAAFPVLVLRGTASTMSYNDQISAEESRDLVSETENTFKSA